MERRRKALGLRRPCDSPEKILEKPSKHVDASSGSSKNRCNSESKMVLRGNVPQKSQPSGSVTPKHKTQGLHSNVTPLKPESPRSPLQSPSSQIMFPGTIASPEIEVSWDWSCSQVPQDMLPPKRVKRLRDTKTQLPTSLSTVNVRPRPRPPLQRQITEEENQQRLEYYKNILSLAPPQNNTEISIDSTNNNMDSKLDAEKSSITPKRPTTRLSSSSKRKNEDITLFDDSANEFMFECSQAIEEKLKNGEIDMGPIVDLKISQVKRSHSPGMESASLHKKTCHGRVNLFPENTSCKNTMNSTVINNNEEQCNSRLPHISDNSEERLNLVSGRTQQRSFNNNEDKLGHTGLFSKSNGSSIPSFQKTESSNKTQNNSDNKCLQKPLINVNHKNLERRPPLTKQAQSTSCLTSTNEVITSEKLCTKRLQGSVNNVDNENVNKFCKPQNEDVRSKNNHATNNCVGNQSNIKVSEKKKINEVVQMKRPNVNQTEQEKPNPKSDVKSLLEDDFDLELSCLDVDSLCVSSGSRQPQIECVRTSASKPCTQQEIEAKRLAALQKLMMKKKR